MRKFFSLVMLAVPLLLAACRADGPTVEDRGPDTLSVVDSPVSDTGLVSPDTMLSVAVSPLGEWTVGRVQAEGSRATSTLRHIRSAQHDGFDRITFEFSDGRLPSVEAEYVDRPIRDCETDEPIELAGDAYLDIAYSPSRIQAQFADLERRLNLNNALRLTKTCTADNEVRWLLDVRSPEAFRITRLSSPARYAVDVIALPPAEQR